MRARRQAHEIVHLIYLDLDGLHTYVNFSVRAMLINERKSTIGLTAVFPTQEFNFILQVRFSPRWCLQARKSKYALLPISKKLPQRCVRNSASVSLTDDGPFSSLRGRSSSISFFLRLSLPVRRWRDVLGSVPASLFKSVDGVMSLALCPPLSSSPSMA